ncbi:MAG TPA: NADH-quinone oxidoreductase subunit M [Solirubrobacteraceae bacterium]|nr:NADH-quinone oxidoreductase subunit M [Solirubrobacteraceae bacterium]
MLHLSILLWLPLAAGVLALLAGPAARWVALAGTVLALGLAIAFVADFDPARAGLQHVTNETWIAELGIHYKLGLSGLNVVLVLLAALLWPAATLWAGQSRFERPGLFFFWMGLAETAVLGALLAQDLALFVIFFDLMLVPFFFLTGGWGGPNRIPAVLKLFIYTLVGSLLMLAGAIATGVLAPTGPGLTFDLQALQQARLSSGSQDWIFLCFAAAFLVKMPAFPIHGWMPDGYRAMPLPALGVFSGVVSKVAAYGFLAIALPLFPHAAARFQELILLIALASILYGSMLAFTVTDTRLVLGYSSLAQLGFITLGIFALNDQGAQGGLLQAVNHGLVVLPAFFIVGLLAARAGGSEDLRDMGGLAFRAPVLAALFLVVALANLAMPGSSNFVGEFFILLGAFNSKLAIAIVASTGVVLASVYTLRLFIRTMHNRVAPGAVSRDLTLRDGLVLVPLVGVIVAFAFYPQFGLKRGEASVRASLAPAKAAQAARTAAADRRQAAAEKVTP